MILKLQVSYVAKKAKMATKVKKAIMVKKRLRRLESNRAYTNDEGGGVANNAKRAESSNKAEEQLYKTSSKALGVSIRQLSLKNPNFNYNLF